MRLNEPAEKARPRTKSTIEATRSEPAYSGHRSPARRRPIECSTCNLIGLFLLTTTIMGGGFVQAKTIYDSVNRIQGSFPWWRGWNPYRDTRQPTLARFPRRMHPQPRPQLLRLPPRSCPRCGAVTVGKLLKLLLRASRFPSIPVMVNALLYNWFSIILKAVAGRQELLSLCLGGQNVICNL